MADRPAKDEYVPVSLDPDPVIEAYKQGIDRTLLRQNLRRSVAERMANLEALQRFAEEVRKAGKKARSR